MIDSSQWLLWLAMALAGFAAGLIDSMAGGGGLIQVPALFSAFPTAPHPTLFGTNKLSSVVGTANAAYRYSRCIDLPWHGILAATIGAFIFAFIGALTVTYVSPVYLKLGLPWLLLGVAAYTFKNKNFGAIKAYKFSPVGQRWVGFAFGSVVGFYDGFFGPGTGSFLVFGFVLLFGFDFLLASASAKVVNIACNVASLFWFAPTGNVMWGLAFWMAFFNLLGSQIGSRLAIRKGAGFVRQVLLAVMFVLICKTAWDAYAPLFRNLS